MNEQNVHKAARLCSLESILLSLFLPPLSTTDTCGQAYGDWTLSEQGRQVASNGRL